MIKKITLYVCEVIFIVCVFAFVAGSLSLYRIHKAPMNVDFTLDKIENTLSGKIEGFDARISQASLYWPDLMGPVLLLLDNVDVSQDNVEQFSLERAAISIARLPLLAGQLKPEALILEGTQLRLLRTSDNKVRVAFDFMQPKDNVGEEPSFDIFSLIEQVLEKNANKDPLFGLKAFEIKTAKIIVEDQVQQRTWSIPNFSGAFTRDMGNVDINLSYMMDGQTLPTDVQFTLSEMADDKINSRYQSSVAFNNFDTGVIGETLGVQILEGRGLVSEGRGNVYLTDEWSISSADISVDVGDGAVKIPGLYNRFLDVSEISLEAQYEQSQDISVINVSSLDVVSNNVALSLSSKIDIQNGQINMPLTVSGSNILVDDIEPFVPDPLAGSVTESWLTTQLADGTINTIELTIPLSFKNVKLEYDQTKWQTNLGEIEADFTYENLTVDYRAPLQKATQVAGQGSFRNDTLSIVGNSGGIGDDLKAEKVTVNISDISKSGQGTADIDVRARGPFASLINYLGSEPINLKDKMDFKPSELKGSAVVDVEIDFPTISGLKADDVVVKASASIKDLYLPRVVKGKALTGGPMKLEARDGYFSLKGKGKLGGHSVDLDYTKYLEMDDAPFAQKVIVDTIADKGMRDIFEIDLDNHILGALPLKVTYLEKENGKAKIDVLADLTPVEFFVEPLNYNKGIGKSGEATLTIFTQNGAIEEVRDLNIKTLDGHIKNARLIFRKVNGVVDMRRASFPDIKLPENVLSVDLERNDNDDLKVIVAGQLLDVRHHLSKDRTSEAQQGQRDKSNLTKGRTIVSGHIDRMKVSDVGVFTGTELYLDLNANGDVAQLELDGRAGQGDIYLRYKPDPFGKLFFRLEATDAGATLKAMNLYDEMEGGILTIEAQRPPQSHINDLKGIAQITDFKIVDAPTLARLLNAVSLVGLQELLNGDGIRFGKMKTEFQRVKKPTGTELLLRDGRTSGSEVGLTFEGKVNQGSGDVDMQGTVIPLSSINKVLGQIPLIGDILTGGDALIAATYTLRREEKGEDIEVFVNPLSALTPGILRKILFEGENPANR